MSVLTDKEVTEIAKLNDEQCKALNDAASKKRFNNWSMGVLFLYGFGAFFFFLAAVLSFRELPDLAGTCLCLTLLGTVAFAVQVITYLWGLKTYAPEELKELF